MGLLLRVDVRPPGLAHARHGAVVRHRGRCSRRPPPSPSAIPARHVGRVPELPAPGAVRQGRHGARRRQRWWVPARPRRLGGSGWDAAVLGPAALAVASGTRRFAEFTALLDASADSSRSTEHVGEFYQGRTPRPDDPRVRLSGPAWPFLVAANGYSRCPSRRCHGDAWVTFGYKLPMMSSSGADSSRPRPPRSVWWDGLPARMVERRMSRPPGPGSGGTRRRSRAAT